MSSFTRRALLASAIAGLLATFAHAGPPVEHGAWAPYPVPGGAALKREDAAAVYDPVSRSVLIYGGFDPAICLAGDVWRLGLDDAEPQWQPFATNGTPPKARSRLTATYDPVRHRIIAYGGLTDCGSGIASDVWALTLSGDPQWSELHPTGEAPRPRQRHAAIYDPVRDRLLIFGGYTGDPFTDELWALNLSGTPSWERLTPDGQGPSPRWMHTATYDPVRDRMLVFGGDLRNANVYALELAPELRWTMSPSKVVLGRMGHAAVYDSLRDRLVVVGGSDGIHELNEAWALPLTGEPVWSQIPVQGPPPAPRVHHVAVWDPVRDQVIVHGGDEARGDTWSVGLAAPERWTPLVGTAPAGALHWTAYDRKRNRMLAAHAAVGGDRVFAFDLGAWMPWVELLPSGLAPRSRAGVSATYDPIRDRVMLFGGSDDTEENAASNETWSLWLGTSPFWQQSGAADPPPGRRGHAAVYDGARDRLLIVGGLGGYEIQGSCNGSGQLRVPVWRPDTWAWSLADSAWSLIGSAPELYGHAAVVDSARDRALSFGGIHELPACVQNGVPEVSYACTSAVWTLDLESGTSWNTLAALGGPPPARGIAAAIVDPARRRIVVFGGEQRGAAGTPVTYLDDTWALNIEAVPVWNELAPSGSSPQERSHAGVAFEAGRSKMWVHGGQGIALYDDLWTLTWDHTTAVLIDLESVTATPRGALVVWRVSSTEPRSASVQRTRDGSTWSEPLAVRLDGRRRLVFDDQDVRPGDRLRYRLRVESGGAVTTSETQWIDIPVAASFRLSPGPNPTRGELAVELGVELGVPAAARVQLRVYDVQGRRVLSQDVSGLEAGTHRIVLAARRNLSAGVYLIEASLAGRVLRSRAVVLD